MFGPLADASWLRPRWVPALRARPAFTGARSSCSRPGGCPHCCGRRGGAGGVGAAGGRSLGTRAAPWAVSAWISGGSGSSEWSTRVDWMRLASGRDAAGLLAAAALNGGGVWPTNCTAILPPASAPSAVLTVIGGERIASSSNNRCSSALDSAAIQCCRRSLRDSDPTSALPSARLEALLMPPQVRRGWGPSCGICNVRRMGCGIVTRRWLHPPRSWPTRIPAPYMRSGSAVRRFPCNDRAFQLLGEHSHVVQSSVTRWPVGLSCHRPGGRAAGRRVRRRVPASDLPLDHQDDGIDAMAGLLADDLRGLGFGEVRLVETKGHPGVLGYYDAGAKSTLVVYMMYDVQPIEANWRIADPFAGSLVEHETGTVLMARGATNQKGPQRAFLNALDAMIKAEGSLPVNVYVVAEGEEELGSPNFGQVIEPWRDRLRKADGAFFPMNIQRVDGSASLNLGVKGIVYFELESKGGEWGGPATAEVHGSLKSLVDSPTLRLVQAIASMTTPDGNTITIPGYYDGVVAPTMEQQRLVNALAAEADDVAGQKALGVSRWIDGMDGREAIVRNLYDPTLNIDGLWSGYTGEGTKTILPHVATAKMDSRLPPGVEPEAVYAMIRKHLDTNGFKDIVIRPMSGYPAASTSGPAVRIRRTGPRHRRACA
ncbi:MAG: M20/M25/M40 family metallo-hydrolase [Lysobacteraceae bacterium]|nr:MAG: M20/M25/M40 family metallo-hydrolase [Xanthomonadaceae bacterium]